MKTIYLECNMGAAGDMLMSALYEICEQKEWFLYKMNEVFAPYGITLTAESAVKCGVRGTHMNVSIHGTQETTSSISPAEIAAHGHKDAVDSPHGHSHPTHDAHGHLHAVDSSHGAHGHAHTSGIAGAVDAHSPAEDGTHAHASGGGAAHAHSDYTSICAQITALDLPEEVLADALAIYRLIGDAEAYVHGTTLEQIHFHEVGSLDALADVTGCALLIRMIAPEQILASPVHVGNGFVRCAHGVLPVPAPATAELLKGIPYYTGSVTSELCTPTGAAILKYYVARFFPMPVLTTSAIGYGLGSKDFEIANCVRAFLGDTASAADSGDEEEDNYSCDDTVLSVSCNIDDMTGEAIGLATEILMAAGALDVYTIPVQMKKSRPGILLTCVCEPKDREKFTGLFFLHTSTRGVRYQTFERAKLESTFETRKTSYGNIRIKKSSGYGIHKEKAEFEDLKSVVLKNNCSLSLDEVKKSLH